MVRGPLFFFLSFQRNHSSDNIESNTKTLCNENETRLLTPLSTIFQLYRGSQSHWWRKLEYPEKTNDLSQVTDNFITYYCIEYT